jgi:Tfp pilus assembly protein PilP
MTRLRGFLLAAPAVLVAVWVSSSTTMPARQAPGGQSAVTEPSRATPSLFELERVTRRLQDGIEAAEAARPAARNPFRFDTGTRAPQEPSPARPVQAITPPSVEPAAPIVILIGIVERTEDGQSSRVGVVSTASGLSYVKAGDRIGDRYEVVSVGDDAIEIRDTTTASTRRITLQ